MTGIELPQLSHSQRIPTTAADSIQRTTLMEIQKTTQTYLCSPRGYFNCHIFSVLIDSWVPSNNCIVGGISRRESLSVDMHTAGGR